VLLMYFGVRPLYGIGSISKVFVQARMIKGKRRTFFQKYDFSVFIKQRNNFTELTHIY